MGQAFIGAQDITQAGFPRGILMGRFKARKHEFCGDTLWLRGGHRGISVQSMQSVGVSGAGQVGCIYMFHREVVTRRQLYKKDIWIDHTEKLGGSGKLKTGLRVSKPCFCYEKVQSIFK